MQPCFEASSLRFNWGLFALSIEACLSNFPKDVGGMVGCRLRQVPDGLVTRKPITQVSSTAGNLHPTLHHCILHSVFVQQQQQLSSCCRKCLHLVSWCTFSSSSYRKCAQVSFPANAACVEYSVVIAGTDDEFPSGCWLAWSPIPSLRHLPSLKPSPTESMIILSAV